MLVYEQLPDMPTFLLLLEKFCFGLCVFLVAFPAFKEILFWVWLVSSGVFFFVFVAFREVLFWDLPVAGGVSFLFL